MKSNTITSKTFEKEVSSYQTNIFYTNKGRGIVVVAAKANIELTIEQVVYIHAVMSVHDYKLIDFGMAYVNIAVGLLFTLMTPFTYKHLLTYTYVHNSKYIWFYVCILFVFHLYFKCIEIQMKYIHTTNMIYLTNSNNFPFEMYYRGVYMCISCN